MLPFFGKYWFAYIPHPNGKILGLSKVARTVDYFSAKLQIQERLVAEVVDYLETALSDKNPPLGMALMMRGEHLCKTMRGAKKQGIMTTSKLTGVFKEVVTRNEFLNLCK
jgi:GTP cyclohydrolase I